MKRIAAFVLGLVVGLPVVAETPPAGPFLCIVEQSTGFVFNVQNKVWHQASFKAGGKFIIKRSKPDEVEVRAWAVWRFGEDKYPYAWCKSEFNDVGYLFCEGVGSQFVFNSKNNRFLSTYVVGYVQGATEAGIFSVPEGGDTPYIEIGTCAAL